MYISVSVRVWIKAIPLISIKDAKTQKSCSCEKIPQYSKY